MRYSTTGSTMLINAQPFVVQHGGQMIAIGHNGTLTNAREIRCRLEAGGSIFQSTMDTEIIVHLMARHRGADTGGIPGQRPGARQRLLFPGDLHRRPGHRRPGPLRLPAPVPRAAERLLGGGLRNLRPGPGAGRLLAGRGARRNRGHGRKMASIPTSPFQPAPRQFCIFEYVYFARPDSLVFGQSVYMVRKRLGAALAREHPLTADLVMPFPDSGIYAALGYAAATGIPFEMGVIRNHYVGRTFIQPSQSMRDFSVRIKLNPVRDILKGQRVIVIEDSIIRGTTTRSRVKSLREAGAKEVSMLVSCPPHRFPCYYGIDFSSKGELIASQQEINQIRDFLGLDYLGYLSLEGLVKATQLNHSDFCLSCFSGDYPVPLESDFSKTCFEDEVCSPSHGESLLPPVCGIGAKAKAAKRRKG